MFTVNVDKTEFSVVVTVTGVRNDFRSNFGQELYDMLCDTLEPLDLNTPKVYDFEVNLPSFLQHGTFSLGVESGINKFKAAYKDFIKKFELNYL